MRTNTVISLTAAGCPIYVDRFTGDPVVRMPRIPIVPTHPKQCPGCEWGMMGHVEYRGEWYCGEHYTEATYHPDAWQEYPTYGEYGEVWGD